MPDLRQLSGHPASNVQLQTGLNTAKRVIDRHRIVGVITEDGRRGRLVETPQGTFIVIPPSGGGGDGDGRWR